MESSGYPSEGHDYVSPEELRALEQHNAAEISQSLAEEARRFRSRFYEALSRHVDYEPSQHLFAVFADKDDSDTNQEALSRNFVAVSAKPPEFRHNDLALPIFKLAQNEFVNDNGYFYCLSEVVSILPRLEARYEVSGVLCDAETGEPLESVRSAMFMNPIQGKLFITPLRNGYVISDIGNEDGEKVMPFGGDGSSAEDSLYAFTKADAIIARLHDQVPIYTQIVS